MEINKKGPEPVDRHKLARDNLEFEARIRGTTPAEELRRRGAEGEIHFRVVSDELTRSRGLGGRILDLIQDLRDTPTIPAP